MSIVYSCMCTLCTYVEERCKKRQNQNRKKKRETTKKLKRQMENYTQTHSYRNTPENSVRSIKLALYKLAQAHQSYSFDRNYVFTKFHHLFYGCKHIHIMCSANVYFFLDLWSLCYPATVAATFFHCFFLLYFLYFLVVLKTVFGFCDGYLTHRHSHKSDIIYRKIPIFLLIFIRRMCKYSIPRICLLVSVEMMSKKTVIRKTIRKIYIFVIHTDCISIWLQNPYSSSLLSSSSTTTLCLPKKNPFAFLSPHCVYFLA